jgi:hypothetical protein
MSDLTISQALRNAARLKGKLAEYRTRAAASVTYRALSKPAYNFDETVKRAESARNELIVLESRLAITNAMTRVEHLGKAITLVQAVKLLQEYKGELAWLKGLSVRASSQTHENEVVYVKGEHTTQQVDVTCDLPEAVRSDRMDEVQSAFDALNDIVEKKNHETPLHAA